MSKMGIEANGCMANYCESNQDVLKANVNKFEQRILQVTGANAISNIETLQTLWGGYGALLRVSLVGGLYRSVITKQIDLPDFSEKEAHPRGWDTQLSHARKLKSYQVELAWYEQYASLCDENHKVPQCIDSACEGQSMMFILEDLAAVGYPNALSSPTKAAIYAGLSWLASFHAHFMNVAPKGLWDEGTYWHLNTRPDELAVLQDQTLKQAANDFDLLLSNSKYQTLVHGDAKLANFCFSNSHQIAAAVDFQYVGRGCGMKDVALFLSSVLTFEETPKQVETYLQHYFREFTSSLEQFQPSLDANDVVATWLKLYPVAWADFQRFVKGWSPDHWKINPFTESLTEQAISLLPALKRELLSRS
jgi:hypothetical protein